MSPTYLCSTGGCASMKTECVQAVRLELVELLAPMLMVAYACTPVDVFLFAACGAVRAQSESSNTRLI